MTAELPIVPLARPMFGEEEIDALRAVLASGWVAGQGPLCGELEARWAARCGTRHAVAVTNCTAALHLALLALGVGAGDDVLVADYTFPATGHAVLHCGARPVFVDVRATTGTIDADRVIDAITPSTKGIIAVDALGLPGDYEALEALCRERGLFLLEDAACSMGGLYHGLPTGSFGSAACFSLHARKGITCGEGGMLTTSRADVAAAARRRSSFGTDSALSRQSAAQFRVPVFDEVGFNYKLSDILAAIAIVQLDRLDDILDRRRRVAAQYQARLASVPGISIPREPDDRLHSWQTFAVMVEEPLDRDAVIQHLRSAGVQSTIGTYACHVQPAYGPSGPCRVSARLFRQQLALPMHTDLSLGDIERVSQALEEAVDHQLQRSSPSEFSKGGRAR